MEATSKLWDLNCEVESPKKVSFLTIRMHLTTLQKEKGRGSSILTTKIKGGDTPDSMFDTLSTINMH